MSDQGAAFAVDPDELAALGRVLSDASLVLAEARRRLNGVRGDARAWAVDGDLPIGLARLLDALDRVAGSAWQASQSLSADVIGASRGYRSAEDAARPRGAPAGRDANPGS